MSNISSLFFVAGESIDIRYQSPSFPSLYFPVKIKRSSTTPTYASKFSTSYIYYVSDIWKFTLYWCLILYPSAYIISGIVTLYNLLHVHNRIFTKQKTHTENNKENVKRQEGFLNFNLVNDGILMSPSMSVPGITDNIKLSSSLTSNSIYYLIIFIYLLLYPTIGLIYGVIYGTVMGFLLGVIYRSALFGMSTWVPLCVSCCSLLYTILSSYKLFGFAL